jgi:hypothetical protein
VSKRAESRYPVGPVRGLAQGEDEQATLVCSSAGGEAAIQAYRGRASTDPSVKPGLSPMATNG